MSTSSPVQHIGHQKLRIRGNLVELTLTGTVTAEENAGMHACYDRVIAEHGHLCLLVDIQHGHSLDPKARRIAVEWARRNALSFHAAVYGGSRPMRAIILLLIGAFRMLGGHYAAVTIVETVEQARSYLAPYRTSPSHPSAPG